MKAIQLSIAAGILLINLVGACKKTLTEPVSPQMEEVLSATAAPLSTTTERRLIKVNLYGGTNAFTNQEWNNWNTTTSLTSSNFKYSSGLASTIKATISHQSSVVDNGTGYPCRIADPMVIRYASASNSDRTLTLTGLDDAKVYNLFLYASRNETVNNTTRFTIGKTSINVKTDTNKVVTATFYKLKSILGKMTVTISKVNANTYLNGFQLTETGSFAVTPPPPTDTVINTPGCNSAAPISYILKPTAGNEVYLPDASARPWKGGDTIKIPAGNYSLIDLGNFRGDACRPIVIINSGGLVNVGQMRFGKNAAYIKISGKGVSSIKYGIKVASAANAGIAIGTAHHVEVENIEVTGTEVGLYFKKNPESADPSTLYPNYVLSNYYIHDNYIHDVHGEGMYIGHTYPNSDPYSNNLVPIRMDKVEIAYNIVDGTDWDGIQLSNARTGAKIHHNTVRNFGRINKGSQQAGIILGSNTNGDIYNNTVSNGTGNGIEAFGYGLIRIYNNTVENSGIDGTTNGQEAVYCNDHLTNIESNPKQQIQFYNNIIRNPKPKGAVRVAAYNNFSLTSTITNNTLYIPNAPVNWLSTYIICNVTGSNISGNTVVK